VPTRAWLKWKENWFWVFMDPERDVCCLAHTTCEPTYGKAFASFTLLHGGRSFGSAKEVPLPEPFEHSKELRLEQLTVRFLEPQSAFQVTFDGAEIEATLNFRRRMHLFDFLACADVNPDLFSISENTGFGRGEFRHQGQSITGTGTIRFKTGDFAGKEIAVDGLGYRDHSWGLRNDALTLDHNWTFINFPDRVFHFMKVRNLLKPGVFVSEGYTGVAEGNKVVKTLEITHDGDGPEKMPATVTYLATDFDGRTYTILADVGHSFARLPLFSQKPGAKTAYHMVENMCRCRLVETGQEGYANVEIGYQVTL
jgi:hypothetical protein